MRTNRFLTGLLGLALAVLAPLAPTAPADAAGLPAREISSRMVKVTAHKIVFKGKVKGDPKYAGKVVRIERRIGKQGTWRSYNKVRSTDLGNWRSRVGVPRTGRWYFRAVTPQTNNYRKSYSGVWYTYTV